MLTRLYRGFISVYKVFRTKNTENIKYREFVKTIFIPEIA
jgi:hypothetical protein